MPTPAPNATTPASGITLLNEPIVFESVPGAGGDWVASIHATGLTSVLAAVFRLDNTAVNNWQVIPLDANGNATIPVHFDAPNEYLNIADPSTFANTISDPVLFGTRSTVTAAGQTVTIAGGASVISMAASGTVLQTGGASTITASAGGLAASATGGSQVIVAGAGGNVIAEAPSSMFVGTAGAAASTLTATAGGSDTIIAGGPVLYNGAAGANSLFVAGTGAVSVVSAASEVVFGGTGGGSYQVGATSFFFIGGGGADTISGGAAKPVIWGATNEQLTIANTAAGDGVVAFGDNDRIDATADGGGSVFYIVNQALSDGSSFSGNTTLTGSSAGNDLFAVFAGSGPAPAAHTITLQNWQASDSMLMAGYGAADIATANAALQAAAPGGGAQFTLSDNTTISFVGVHPTAVFG